MLNRTKQNDIIESILASIRLRDRLLRSINSFQSIKPSSHSLRCANRVTRFATAQRFPLFRNDARLENFFSRFTSHLSLGKAFTLSEVLLTLGIIGVVAAMTLPTVVNNIQDAQFKSAWKKEYSTLTNAINQVYAEEGVTYNSIDYPSWEYMPRYYCKLQKRLKIIASGMKCPEDEDSIPATDADSWPYVTHYSGYWHKNDEWQNKSGMLMHANTSYFPMSAILADGAMINFYCTYTMHVDVNGYKKPNVIGRDIFYFNLNWGTNRTAKTGFWSGANICVSAPYATTILQNNYKEDCESGTGWGCSPMYILNQ